MGSGMGMASIGIYSFELYSFYGVENIIRIGSAGSYCRDCNIYDLILVDSAWSESTFAKVLAGYKEDIMFPSEILNDKIKNTAETLNVKIKDGRIHSTDVFYRNNFDKFKTIRDKYGCIAAEMESFELFANARSLNKNASCLLTITDSLVTNEKISAEEREKSLSNMIRLALESV